MPLSSGNLGDYAIGSSPNLRWNRTVDGQLVLEQATHIEGRKDGIPFGGVEWAAITLPDGLLPVFCEAVPATVLSVAELENSHAKTD